MKIKQMLRIFAIIITHILLPLGIGYMLLLGIYMTYNAFKDIEDLANRSDVNDLDTLKVQEKQIEASDNADDKNFVEPAKSLEEQFDGLYKSLNEYSLPISLAPKERYPRSPEGAIKFTEMPKSLIPIFKFLSDSYDKNFLNAAKLPKNKNIDIIIIRVFLQSGQDELYLCTFLNNTIIDWLEIYSVGEAEYGATIITSFSIASNYEISIKTAFYPNTADAKEELDVKQNTYIISDGGKFVKK